MMKKKLVNILTPVVILALGIMYYLSAEKLDYEVFSIIENIIVIGVPLFLVTIYCISVYTNKLDLQYSEYHFSITIVTLFLVINMLNMMFFWSNDEYLIYVVTILLPSIIMILIPYIDKQLFKKKHYAIEIIFIVVFILYWKLLIVFMGIANL